MTSMWQVPSQQKRRQRNTTTLLKQTHHQGNRRNTSSTHSIPQLHRKQPRCHYYLQSK
jgi:hypothetical protein